MLTWVEIDRRAIEYNILQFKKIIGPKTQLIPVIKSNAYGHGILNVAKICDQNKNVNKICVVNLDEAVLLIKNKIKKQIIILSFFDATDEKNILRAASANTVFPLYSLNNAVALNKIGEKAGKNIKMHLKIDTGATRLGVLPQDTIVFLDAVKKLKFIKVEGVFSHFASSESDGSYTKKQHFIFCDTLKKLSARGYDFTTKHMACSAAVINYDSSRQNAVRLGLSLYGLYPAKSLKNKINLKPAMSWRVKIIQIKKIPKNTRVGYGNTYITKKPTIIAVLPIGYYDGYDRSLGNRGQVIINGKICKVLGRICMNIFMVDVSSADAKQGDIATLLGRQGKNTITADQIASWANTINYEIVSRINPLITRIVIPAPQFK